MGITQGGRTIITRVPSLFRRRPRPPESRGRDQAARPASSRRRVGAAVGLMLATVLMASWWPVSSVRAAVPVKYDVVVYGTTTSGVGAVRALTLLRRVIIPQDTTIAIISSGRYLESPLANGLMVEDMYLPQYYASGLWKDWRAVFGQKGRLKVSSTDASYWLWWRLNKPGVTFYAGSLTAADPSTKSMTLRSEDGGEVTVSGTVIIDASATLDLARAFGCEYRIGKDESVYGPDRAPAPPTAANGYITCPQAMAGLPSFVAAGTVPVLWSTTTGKLPSGLCEFNEGRSDYRVPQDIYDWVFRPDLRAEIKTRVRDWSIGQLYPGMRLVYYYPWPYFRGEVTIANGLTRFTGDQVGRKVAEPVARSCYQTYDRHDLSGSTSSSSVSVVWAPWKAMMPAEHDWLLVTEGACVDSAAYNSSFRMEPMRMDYGGAAGATAALALARGVPPQELQYEDLRAVLVSRLLYRF